MIDRDRLFFSKDRTKVIPSSKVSKLEIKQCCIGMTTFDFRIIGDSGEVLHEEYFSNNFNAAQKRLNEVSNLLWPQGNGGDEKIK